MAEQTFKLEINAESPDGNEINQNTRVKVNCSGSMATGVIIHALKSSKDLEEIVLTAIEEYLDQKVKDRIKMN